jgi:hypothetical protein
MSLTDSFIMVSCFAYTSILKIGVTCCSLTDFQQTNGKNFKSCLVYNSFNKMK